MQNLDLSFCHKLETQNHLVNLPSSITTLVLGGLQVDGEQLQKAISRLHKLEDLHLCGINTLDDDALRQVRNVQEFSCQIENKCHLLGGGYGGSYVDMVLCACFLGCFFQSFM